VSLAVVFKKLVSDIFLIILLFIASLMKIGDPTVWISSPGIIS